MLSALLLLLLLLLVLLPATSVAEPTDAQRAAAAASALDVASFHGASAAGARRVELLRELYHASSRRPVLRNGTVPSEVALCRFTEKLLLGDEGSCSSDSSSSSGQQAEPGPGPSARELARQRAEEAALLADLAAEKTIDDQEREGLSADAAARERLQRLQRFAKAVRQHLPPRSADALHVVVVGAGPAGLLTAIEATRAGAAVTVLEKRSEYMRSVS